MTYFYVIDEDDNIYRIDHVGTYSMEHNLRSWGSVRETINVWNEHFKTHENKHSFFFNGKPIKSKVVGMVATEDDRVYT